MKMKHSPLVSINIRTYNSEKTLAKTLQSIKDQDYPSIEVIVSDGYSTDGSVEIAKRFGARINFARKLGDARQENYKQSNGAFILSVDSDQLLDPNVVSRCVELCGQGYDAVTISEKSIIRHNTIVEKLIAYDKYLIDSLRDDDLLFGTACPRFFKQELLRDIEWSKGLSIFDDTILYATLLKKGAKIAYLSDASIRHYEVDSFKIVFQKFYRYGQGYFKALAENPATIVSRSLPRRSYFSLKALSRPHYFLGLIALYTVKAAGAGLGALSYLSGTVNIRPKLVAWGDSFYYQALARELTGMDSVLDLGCGSNSPLAKVPKTFHSTGVDIFAESIEKSKEKKIHDDYILSDILSVEKKLPKQKFDAVIALDVIEHLSKKDGIKLLSLMERLAKRKVLLLTPNGFYKQEPYENNPYQIHRSGWYANDFASLGYRCYGMRGLKYLRGEYATITLKPWIFWATVSVLSQPLFYFFPKFAYQLLAVKKI